jgi:GNAT superfamily N-acetyltransferase
MGQDSSDELPDGRCVVSDMGTHIYTRPWAEGDLRRLQEAEPSFSVDTLTSRFLIGTIRLPPAYLAALRRPATGRPWLGQVALADGELVGMAECAWLTGSAQPAELAVLVADGWQRRGVGRLVVDGVLSQAETAGITHLQALADAANEGCHALARSVAGGRNRPDGWPIRWWVTGGQRHFELRRRRVPTTMINGSRPPSAHPSRPASTSRLERATS